MGLLIGLMLILVGLLYALALVIPAATITLVPASERTELTVLLRAVQDAGTDSAAGIVPARVLSAQVSGDARIATTGRRAEPTVKAKGEITLINRTSRPVAAPAGTIVATATGSNVQFATTASVALVPGGRVAVPAEAVLPGPMGNVRAGTITRVEGPLALMLLVTNERSFSGGATSQVGIVTEEDKDRLLAQLSQELKEQAYERLSGRMETRSLLPEQSVSYLALSPTFTPFVGEVSNELYLSMSMQAVGLSVNLGIAEQVALARLQQAMPPGTRLISDTVRFAAGAVLMENPSTAAFDMTARGTLLLPIDARAARQAVVGLSPEEGIRVLSERFDLAQPPVVSLGPDWLPYIVPTRLPILPWRIRVIVDWDAAARVAGKP